MPAPAEAIALDERFGIDLRDHRAHYIGNAVFSASDLVIGYESTHTSFE